MTDRGEFPPIPIAQERVRTGLSKAKKSLFNAKANFIYSLPDTLLFSLQEDWIGRGQSG